MSSLLENTDGSIRSVGISIKELEGVRLPPLPLHLPSLPLPLPPFLPVFPFPLPRRETPPPNPATANAFWGYFEPRRCYFEKILVYVVCTTLSEFKQKLLKL